MSLAALTAGAVAIPSAGASSASVNVVGYSVVGPAFKALEAAFQATPAGQGVTFTNSFGASDTETNNVANGLAADIVNLSYKPNIATLVGAGKVPVSWNTQESTIAGVHYALTGNHQQTTYPTAGIITDSVVVFVVRKGNPLNIQTWSDLTKTGVQVVTPNPQTSGSAKWNLLAGYTSQLSLGRSPVRAQDYLKALLSNTVAQPSSGSSSLAAFLAGTGNVLLAYEDDALAAVAAGDPVQIVTPPQSLLIENPLALTSTGVTNPSARAFYKYLYSSAGQQIFANLGYRPVLSSVWNQAKTKFAPFTTKNSLWTIARLNKIGWAAVDPAFFGSYVSFSKKDPTHPVSGIVTYLEKYAGTNG
jgi:sulfate/thiosulfate transport system substrate-binding protein